MIESAYDESDFESLFDEDIENDEFDAGEYDEFDERVRRRRPKSFRPSLRTPPRGNPTVQPPKTGYATKAELDATAKKLDARIATTSASIKTLDRRTVTAERELTSVGSALRKEIALRKKETGDLKKGLDESRQMAMIMPLLGGGDDKFSKMLPVLLYGGMLGGGSGTAGTGDNSMMMTMMMVMALGD